MSDTAIRVENLSKMYRIGRSRDRHDSLRDALGAAARAPLGWLRRDGRGGTASEDTIWALKDVSFEVQRGEVLGIIGRNGAGKSTLLKILTRITEPTEGRAEIHGRVGSLLEVGTGFHPELTGRENVFLSGAILGMSRTEIARKFVEIVDFSGVERFIDTPFKRYSSGMRVRLGFAVAAHLEPEILLIDEVLAVGDAAFQKKCLGKMGRVASEGRTVLFVSHNMGAISRLSGRALWLRQGTPVLEGSSNEVVGQYQLQYLDGRTRWTRTESHHSDGSFAFLDIAVMNGQGQPCSLFAGNEAIIVQIRYVVSRPLSGCQVGSRLYNSHGVVVLSTADSDSLGFSALPKKPGLYRATLSIPGSLLAPQTYYLSVAAHLPQRQTYDVVEQAVVFEVSPTASLSSLDGRMGVVCPLIPWETTEELLP